MVIVLDCITVASSSPFPVSTSFAVPPTRPFNAGLSYVSCFDQRNVSGHDKSRL